MTDEPLSEFPAKTAATKYRPPEDRQKGLSPYWRDALRRVRGSFAGDSDNTAQKQMIFIVSGISSFVVPFMMSAVNVALPDIGVRFSLSAVALGWVVSAYLLATAASLLPAGRTADILGRKGVFVLGMAVFALSSLVSAFSQSYAVLLASRVAAGIGAAMAFATGTAILMAAASPKDRGQVLGWNVAAVYLGLSMGPPLGGLITHALGWKWIFVFGAAAGLATAVLAARGLKHEAADADGESFDPAGAVLWGMALTGLMCGLTRLPGLSGIAMVAFGGICFFMFVRWEQQSKSPLLDIRAFTGNRSFLYSNLAALINYSATMAVAFLLSLYLQYQKGLTARDAGLVLVIQPVVMAIVSPLSGRLSDRIEPRKLASAGMAVTVLVLAALSFLRRDTSLWLVRAALVVLGLCFGVFSSPNTNAVMSSVERGSYGIASSTLATMRVVGQAVSMGITTMIMTLFLGSARIAPGNLPELMKSMRVVFAVSAVLCLFGVLASLSRGGRLTAGSGPEH